jgi:3',5'-cyclic AMP phosphodiesterase CpdA
MSMKLYAVSDLHLANRVNLQAVEALPAHPDDWLILAGDTGELEEHLQVALILLSARFKQLLWVPGNHDLWTLPTSGLSLKGEARYRRLVSLCRDFGVLTPEDPYVRWPGKDRTYLLAPLFLLYDYSFRPPHIPLARAVEWAAESGVVCTDEELLLPDPYPSPAAWCAQRCQETEKRLEKAAREGVPMILINHFPLRQDMAQLRRFPRFSLWCGTRRTENWHTRFPVSVVVYGHMHIRGTHYREGVRFEEVSLGYPRDWNHKRGLDYYLREILPGPGPEPALG